MNVMCYGVTELLHALIGMFGLGVVGSWMCTSTVHSKKTFNESKHNRYFRWPYADKNCDMHARSKHICIFVTTGVIG